MKKILFVLIIGVGVAGWYFYDPYLKPYMGSYVDKVKETLENAGEPTDKPPADGGKTVQKPNEDPIPQDKAPLKEVGKRVVPKDQAEDAPLSEIDALLVKRYPMPDIKPLLEIVDNWRRVPPKAYPKQVTIKQRVAFQLVVDGQTLGASVAVPGTLVAPLGLDGETLHVASLANQSMKSQVPVDQTDFKELVQKHYDEFVVNTRNQVHSNRAKAKKNLAANPEIYKNFGKAEAGWDDPNDPRFELVKASLANGEVKAVQLNEAKQFRWNGSEKINGDKYQGTFDTVSVKFEVNTIFGVFPNEFKCLVQAGRVVGWIDPLTLEEKI
jgi:hypothetical protein